MLLLVLAGAKEGLWQELKELLNSEKVLLELLFFPGGEEKNSDGTAGLMGVNWLLLGVEDDDMMQLMVGLFVICYEHCTDKS